LFDRYNAGDVESVYTQLAARTDKFEAFSKDLTRATPGWVQSGGSDKVMRRRLVVGGVALEAIRRVPVRRAEYSERLASSTALDWPARRQLLEWACTLVRTTPSPPAAERWWHLAAVALLEESSWPPFLAFDLNYRVDAHFHIDHARARFPDEPRFQLAHAVIDHNAGAYNRGWLISSPDRPRFWVRVDEGPGPTEADLVIADPSPRNPSPDRNLRDAVRRLASLLDDASVGPEAHMRLGDIEVFAGQPELALPHFVRAEASSDPVLAYVARLFRAAALTRLGRVAEAESAYHDALALVPNAQSATVGLTWLLLNDHRTREAAEFSNPALTLATAIPDPFELYRHEDARFLPAYMERFRASLP
jgi:hypothetical protein